MTPVKPFALAFTFLVHISSPVAAQFGQFEGTPQVDFVSPPCGTTFAGPARRLLADFHYLDASEAQSEGSGRRWVARIPMCTDGASIPDWALIRAGVGDPFDPDILPAAVIHDHYTESREYSARATHRVFYDGLRANGVSWSRAAIMYAAVLMWNPHWTVVKFEAEQPSLPGLGNVLDAGSAIRQSVSEFQSMNLDGRGRVIGTEVDLQLSDLLGRFQETGEVSASVIVDVPPVLGEAEIDAALARLDELLATRDTEPDPAEIEAFVAKAQSEVEARAFTPETIYLRRG